MPVPTHQLTISIQVHVAEGPAGFTRRVADRSQRLTEAPDHANTLIRVDCNDAQLRLGSAKQRHGSPDITVPTLRQ